MSKELSVDVLKKVVPKSLKTAVTPELIQHINEISADDQLRDYYRENIIGFSTVLNTGKFKLTDYANAVKYCTYKLYGDTNADAWVKTFPDRYQRLVDKSASPKDISSHVAAYNKNILVNRVMELTIIPSYVLNHDIHQTAINTLAALMGDSSVSAKVRSDSANSLLTHLKVPEAAKVEIGIDLKDSGVLTDLRKATEALATQQRAAIQSGETSAKGIAESNIIEGTAKVIDNE